MRMTREITDLFDANGFLADPSLWDRDLALRIAAQIGLGELSESHWAVVDYLRENYLVGARLPWEGNICGAKVCASHRSLMNASTIRC